MKKILTLLISGMTILVLTGTGFSAETFTYSPNDGYGDLDDLNDLDHSYAYAWEINLGANDINGNLIDTSQIVGAKLVFTDLYNWNDDYNILHVNALNPEDTVGNYPGSSYTDSFGNNQGKVTTYYDLGGDTDTANYFVDANGFSGAELLFQIENLDEIDRGDNNPLIVELNENPNAEDTVIDNVDHTGATTLKMQADTLGTLTSYISNNILTLGFDPDCHFYNQGIALVLTTSVPTTPGNQVPEPGTLLLFGFGLIGVSAFGRKRMNMDDEIN